MSKQSLRIQSEILWMLSWQNSFDTVCQRWPDTFDAQKSQTRTQLLDRVCQQPFILEDTNLVPGKVLHHVLVKVDPGGQVALGKQVPADCPELVRASQSGQVGQNLSSVKFGQSCITGLSNNYHYSLIGCFIIPPKGVPLGPYIKNNKKAFSYQSGS